MEKHFLRESAARARDAIEDLRGRVSRDSQELLAVMLEEIDRIAESEIRPN